MYPDLLTSLFQSLTLKTALPGSAHMRRGTRLVERSFSDEPSVIRHLRVPYVSLLVPTENIRNEVSFPASGGHGKYKKPLVTAIEFCVCKQFSSQVIEHVLALHISCPDLQFEAIQSRTNIAPRASRERGAFPILVQLLASQNNNVNEQPSPAVCIVYALGSSPHSVASRRPFSLLLRQQRDLTSGVMAEAHCVWGCTFQMETVSRCSALVSAQTRFLNELQFEQHLYSRAASS